MARDNTCVSIGPHTTPSRLAQYGREFRTWLEQGQWRSVLETELALDPEDAYGFDALNLGAEAVLDFVHEHVLPVTDAANDIGRAFVRSRTARIAAATKMAANILTVDAAKIVFLQRSVQIARQVEGVIPVHDDDGNELSGQAAIAKRINIYNHWTCQIQDAGVQFGKTWGERLAEHAVAWLVEERNKPLTLEEAREVYLERFDQAVRDRCVFLFDGPSDAPHNSKQADARYTMLGYRRGLKESLADATTVASCKTAADTAIASVTSTEVERSPVWFHGSTTVTTGAVSDTYTRGTGQSKWKLALAVRTTGVEPEQHGKVTLDPLPESDEFAFAVTRQASSAVTVTVQRKSGATGHPPAAVYPFTFVARNDNGASSVTATIDVPETAQPPPSSD